MTPAPYVRLRSEDLSEKSGIWGWALASAEVVAEIGLPATRPIRLPLAGRRQEGRPRWRQHVREGLVSLLAIEPSHPDRTLYLEVVDRFYPGFGRWLEQRVARAFARERHASALREAVALVNLLPGRAEARFNLGLLLTRMVAADPGGADVNRWTALARGEFGRAAELSPELLCAHYHRGVLAYEAGLPAAAGEDWLRFLDRYFADKRAPRGFQLPLLPLETGDEAAELPALAYTVLLDFLHIAFPRRSHPADSVPIRP